MQQGEASSPFEEWAHQYSEPWAKLVAEEDAYRRERRKKIPGGTNIPVAGLALSGGGIRSATFSLGVLRELAALKLLYKFDYLSTVSGGSYIGAYYCSLFVPRGTRPAVLSDAEILAGGLPVDPFALKKGSKNLPRASLDWLRQSGRYLAPSGAGDYWHAAGVVTRNWIGLHIVIGTTIMLAALLAVVFRLTVYNSTPLSGHPLVHGAPLVLLLALPVAWHAVLGWAFWLTKRDIYKSSISKTWVPTSWAITGTVVIAIVAALIALPLYEPLRGPVEPLIAWLPRPVAAARVPALTVSVLAVFALLALWGVWLKARDAIGEEERWDRCRTLLSRPMRYCTGAFAAILAAAACDAAAYFAFQWAHQEHPLGWLVPAGAAAGSGGLVATGRWLVSRLAELTGSVPSEKEASGGDKKGVGLRPLLASSRDVLFKLAGGLAAILLLIIVLLFWSALAYEATWPARSVVGASSSGCPWKRGTAAIDAVWHGCTSLAAFWRETGGQGAGFWGTWLWWAAVLGFLFLCIARTPGFLNLSSLTSFYAGRLRRAYLGAGNPCRIDPDFSRSECKQLDRWDAGDDILFEAYYRFKNGEPSPSLAPLHLINITLNETRGGPGSAIVQRDRRGRNLVLSPAGIYCSADRPDDVYRLKYSDDKHENLPLSTWVAISGAAVSTGLGSRSGFPLSYLAGLANVRLGYWWRARSEGRGASPTQVDLLREFRGDFSGPGGKYWYLSDGGHFENTGVYELIRRKVSFIVVCDNGMDERFEYEDVANLVRKARIDFECEIDFLSRRKVGVAAGLDDLFRDNEQLRACFGTLGEITGQVKAEDGRVAALARLKYADGTPGTLVLIKPRLTGDGPADLMRYKAANEKFPQQTTLDQFFDEAQWESYYNLGRLIAQSVFGKQNRPAVNAGNTWAPGSLQTIFSSAP